MQKSEPCPQMNCDIDEFKEHVSGLLTFKNRLIGTLAGVSFLAGVVLLGSYTYTYILAQQVATRDGAVEVRVEGLHGKDEVIAEELTRIKIQNARIDERYVAIQKQLATIDIKLEEVLKEKRPTRNR